MITVKEKIPTTQQEIDSVQENNRLTLSEELHGRHRGKRSSNYRARYDPGIDDIAIYSEEF